MRESTIERHHVDAVRACGGLSLKWVSPGCRGVPDRIDLYPGGQVVFTELKASGEVPNELQKRMKRKLEALGFVVVVVDHEL